MVRVERLTAAEWQSLRDVRLRGLLEDPESFGSSWQDEQDGEEEWLTTWVTGSAWFVSRADTGETLGAVVGVPRGRRRSVPAQRDVGRPRPADKASLALLRPQSSTGQPMTAATLRSCP